MTIQSFLGDMWTLIYHDIIPFLLGIAFLVFIWNVVRYFIVGAANETEREKARAVVLWSVLAFVIILVFWGIVNIITNSTGLQRGLTPPSEYLPQDGGSDSPPLGGGLIST